MIRQLLRTAPILAIGAMFLSGSGAGAQNAVRRPVDGRPDATVDLRTREGAAIVKGQWRYSDARPVEVTFKRAGADLKPSGPAVETLDQATRAGAADFDDSGWEAIDPASLEVRRSPGKQSFAWYRIKVTIPERVGSLSISGTTAVFEIVVDDYAEVWVDGQLPRTLGQSGGQLIAGFNAPNRIVLTNNAQPGQRFQIAVFAANGPLSDPPPNFIWVRSASIDFYKRSEPVSVMAASVERKDPALDAIVPADVQIEKVAGGFLFTEGPVWSPDGFLLFSDPNANTIYRWSESDGLSVFRTKSGYSGPDIGEYGQPGSNGLAIDADGRLTINEHGNRRVTRLEKNGVLTVLADRFEGRRLNSPNDLVYRSDGSLYFTDPPFGLPKVFDDPRNELGFSGVYRLAGGRLSLVTRELSGPNGIAFSPDERYLYVGDWDEKRKIVMRYEVRSDGSIAAGTVFFDMTSAPGEDAIDGVKTDRLGNVYVSGPGGLWILSPDGRHLGTINGPEHIHNFAWGDADGRTLYLTARTGLYRVRLRVGGGPRSTRTDHRADWR
jgi:gluconolactonase